MGTYTQIIYQIVFGTWNHEHTLVDKTRQELFKYIWGILKKKRCHLYRIGGVADHIHIVTHLHPTEPLASLVKDIKLAGSEFIKTNKLFPSFSGWQDACLPARQGYGAFTYSSKDKNRLIEYVKNQESHHKTKTFREEYIELLNEHDIEFNEKYLL